MTKAERLAALRLILSQLEDGKYEGDSGFGPFRRNKVEQLLGQKEWFGNLYDNATLFGNAKDRTRYIEERMEELGLSDEVLAIIDEYALTEKLTADEIATRSDTDIERGINLQQGEINTAVLEQLLSIQDRQGVVELYDKVGIAEDVLPAFLTERSDFANDLQRKMFEIRGAAFGDDRIAMIESAEFQDLLRASIQSIVLYEVENNEEYPLRLREFATANRKALAEEVRILTTGSIFKDVVGAATNVNWLEGVEPGSLTYEMAGSEWFTIEDRILALTGNRPDERLERRLAQELRDAESTDPVKYFTENWEPNIREFTSAYDRIDVNGYDGTLNPLVERWLDPNIKGQLRVDLRNSLKQKLLEHFNNTGTQNKQDLVRDYLGVTDESPAPDYSGYEAAINDYMAIMVGDDGIVAGLTASGLDYRRLLELAPAGTVLNTTEEIIDYVYGYVEDWNGSDAGQAAPIVPTSTRVDSNVLIRRELIKVLGGGTFANIPNSMYGALFDRIESELEDANRIGNIVQDSAGVEGFINKHAARLVASSLRQQVLSVEGGELLVQAWESMGVQTMDGLVNMVSTGDLDGTTYSFDSISSQLTNAAPFSQRQAQVQASLSSAGLNLLPEILRGDATNDAISKFNELFASDEYKLAYENVFDRTNAVLEADAYTSILPTYVDQALETSMGNSPLLDAMIDLYGSARNMVTASGINPTNMTSKEYVSSLEEFGMSLSTRMLDKTHTPESVDKFSNLRDSFENSGGEATDLQKMIRASVLTFAEGAGITDVDEIGALINEAMSFANNNIGPLRVFQSADDFIDRADIQGQIGKIAGEQTFGKLRTEGIREFIEGQFLDSSQVVSLGGFAQSLFDDLESLSEDGATPKDILESDEFIQAFAKERQAADERAEAKAEAESPMVKQARERQTANMAHTLLDPQLQAHVGKFLGATGDIGDPADVQREFEKFVQDQQAQTSAQAQSQTGTGWLSTQTTGEVLSFGDYLNKLDSVQSPSSSANFYQSFLTQRLGSDVLVGKQRQTRVNRIRTASPTGGKQIRNPSLGVGL